MKNPQSQPNKTFLTKKKLNCEKGQVPNYLPKKAAYQVVKSTLWPSLLFFLEKPLRYFHFTCTTFGMN